jgi:hypothetical protein
VEGSGDGWSDKIRFNQGLSLGSSMNVVADGGVKLSSRAVISSFFHKRSTRAHKLFSIKFVLPANSNWSEIFCA